VYAAISAAIASPKPRSRRVRENLGLDVFADRGPVEALLRVPDDPELHSVVVDAAELEIIEDPLQGRIEWIPRRR
jgi:hypothetical protein